MSFSAEWKDGYDYETETHLGSMYVYEHNDIFNSKLTVLTQNNSILCSWKGFCEVNGGDDEDDENVPFEIESSLKFLGIRVAIRSGDPLPIVAEYFPKVDMILIASDDRWSYMFPKNSKNIPEKRDLYPMP